jgi:hypothetical protein
MFFGIRMSRGCKRDTSCVTVDRDKIARHVPVMKTPPLTKHLYVRCTLSHAQAYFAFYRGFRNEVRSLIGQYVLVRIQ